jgi:hypothetical protein
MVLPHCRERPTLELLQVDAVLPAEAQFGDSVQILGDGFGLGSPAMVTWRGAVYRAGRAPEAVEFSFRARTESQRELSLTLPRDAERAFCGDPEQASHATFRGDVEVAIAAHALGAPPATGSLHGVVVELYPAVKTRGSEHQSSERGHDVLGFLGLELAAARAGGLEVIRVAPGSRASAVDLRPGDRLVRAGGLTVLEPSDLVPDASRLLELGVVRGDVDLTARVDVDGFSPRPPRALGWAALPILAAALWFLATLSPLSRLFGWVGHNWLEQERARRRALRRDLPSSVRAPDWPRAIELFGGASGLLVWLGVASALSAPLLRRTPVDVTRGLLVTLSVSAALLIAFAFAAGEPAPARWSLRKGALAALQQWLCLLPAGVALLATGFASGIDLDDVVHAQGAWPWQWNAFHDPGLFVACGALLSSTVPRPGKPIWRLAHARPPRLSWRSDGDGWFDRLYLCSTCALAAAVFLGGDALPATVSGSGPLPALLTAAVLVSKYTLLVLGVSFLRGLCLGLDAAHFCRFAVGVGLPAAVAAVAVTEAWRWLGATSSLWSWVQRGFGPASAAALLLALAVVSFRAYGASRDPGPPSLSPWL